jgi:stage V sporulation protein G
LSEIGRLTYPITPNTGRIERREPEPSHYQLVGGERGLKVTDVRLRRMQPGGKMRAYASVTLDDEFVVHEMRVIDGPRGLFVAMPSRRASDGEFRDIAHPITAEARQYIQTAVLEAFGQATAQQEAVAEAAAVSTA